MWALDDPGLVVPPIDDPPPSNLIDCLWGQSSILINQIGWVGHDKVGSSSSAQIETKKTRLLETKQ